MRPNEIDTVTPAAFPQKLPIDLDQRTSRTQAIFFLALLLPAVLAMLVPLAFVTMTALAEPSAREAIAARPWTTLLTFAGLAIWLALWSVPLRRFWASLTFSRRVKIDASGEVVVEDRSLFKKKTWTARLSDYEGLRHDVRSSLSGTRRELRLIHRNPARDVMLHAAPFLTDEKTAELARLLDCRVLPSIGTAPAPKTGEPAATLIPAAA